MEDKYHERAADTVCANCHKKNMAPENNTKATPSSLEVQSNPNTKAPTRPYDAELLMAARRGEWVRLERLLGIGEGDSASAAPQLVIPIEIEEVVSDAAHVGIMPSPAVTEQDSLLHVIASRGDGEEFLRSASVIYGKAKHLLDARNKKGDTPLHCAARAGHRGMVAHLVFLARSQNDANPNEKVKAILRVQNKRGETALHEAVRSGDMNMVGRLLAEDPQLARVPLSEGTSPLYLAAELGHHDIVRQLYDKDPALSYSGPDGRNALHAAVLKGPDTTKLLLEWNKDLIKQADRSSGSTPLHFAASCGQHEVIRLLLDVDPTVAYQPDSNGSFPIHLAAFMDEAEAIRALLDTRHDCVELCDAMGKTFLHVAIKEESMSVVKYACMWKRPELAASSFINMQDDDGNTALHFAVEIGNLWILRQLIKNRLVTLDVANNKGLTPFDISRSKLPAGVAFGYNNRNEVHKLLQDAGARNGTHRNDLYYKEHIPGLDEKEEAQKITTSTQIVGIGCVLIATVAFAAAFTLPGGYRGDGHKNGGTPLLVGRSAFHVFIIADTLAFVLSSISITILIYAGVANGDIGTRMANLVLAEGLMTASARSLSAAFGFGLYVVLAPVARTTAIASLAITALTCGETVFSILIIIIPDLRLLKTRGARPWWRRAPSILVRMLWEFWPYIVIAGVVKCLKI